MGMQDAIKSSSDFTAGNLGSLVVKKSSRELLGSCNFCPEGGETIYSVEGNRMSVRFCESCIKSLGWQMAMGQMKIIKEKQ